MKKYAVFAVTFLVIGCHSKKDASQKSADKIALTTTECPENGTCTIVILKNKSLDVKADEFGHAYYHVVDNLEKSVVKFEFTKGNEEKYADSGYREEITFEIENANPEVDLSGTALQATKMLYGRFCFCRGTTGNYPVIDGHLIIQKKDNKFFMNLDFKSGEIPQIINRISAIIK